MSFFSSVYAGFFSRINWTQAVAFVASALVLASGGKYNIPAEQQAQIIMLIQTVQSLTTWVLRTFFTKVQPK